MMRGLRSWLRRTITYTWARRLVVGVIGGTVLLVGVVMIILPGPALIVIPFGLAILGLEFAWARIWLRKVKVKAKGVVDSVRRARNGTDEPR